MFIGLFSVLPALIGLLVRFGAYEILSKRLPKKKTAQKFARFLQIIAITLAGLIFGSLTLNIFNLVGTGFYVGILASDLILSLVFEEMIERIKTKNKQKPKESAGNTILAKIERWAKSYSTKTDSLIAPIKEFLEKIFQNPITKWVLILLEVTFLLLEKYIYKYVIGPFVLDVPIIVLKWIENRVNWLSENVLDPLLGEIIALIVQFISKFSLQVSRGLIELIRDLLDRLFNRESVKF